nr:TRAP transporter large permease subunit [Celeribacter baekdonensis]
MIGAGIFSYFLTLVQVPQMIAGAITQSGVPPMLSSLFCCCSTFRLGCFWNAFSMMVITLPIVFRPSRAWI